MKKYLLFSMMIILAAQAGAQVSEIHFTYDESGNRISRSIGPKENLFELGSIETSQSGSSTWTTITLENSYDEPVVFMGPMSFNGGNPSNIRVRNVKSTSFQFQIDEWDYIDGAHTIELINYIVIERGFHALGSLKYEAGVRSNIDDNYSEIQFLQAFTSTPVVFAQVTSYNESSAVVSRVMNVDTSSFLVRIQEEEANDDKHIMEKMAYLAIEPGNTLVDDKTLEVGRTGTIVDEYWETIQFGSSYSEPIFLADDQTVNGGDPVSLRMDDLTASSVRFFLEEEESADTEVGHLNENVGYMVMELGPGMGKVNTESTLKNLSEDTEPETTKTTEINEEEEYIPPKVEIYPNPTDGELTIEIAGVSDMGNTEIKIIRVSGEIIQHIVQPRQLNRVDLSAEPTGMYIIRFQVGEKIKDWKVLKQ